MFPSTLIFLKIYSRPAIREVYVGDSGQQAAPDALFHKAKRNCLLLLKGGQFSEERNGNKTVLESE